MVCADSLLELIDAGICQEMRKRNLEGELIAQKLYGYASQI
jgi:hypothetical protein